MQSLSVNDGGATGRTGVFAKAEAGVVCGSGNGSNGEAEAGSNPARTTNINMDAAVLHAVTDLVRCCVLLFCFAWLFLLVREFL